MFSAMFTEWLSTQWKSYQAPTTYSRPLTIDVEASPVTSDSCRQAAGASTSSLFIPSAHCTPADRRDNATSWHCGIRRNASMSRQIDCSC